MRHEEITGVKGTLMSEQIYTDAEKRLVKGILSAEKRLVETIVSAKKHYEEEIASAYKRFADAGGM